MHVREYSCSDGPGGRGSFAECVGGVPRTNHDHHRKALFNDGTAMVLFLLFDSLAQKHKKYVSGAGNPPYEVIEFFARMVLGGCFIGLAFGGAALLCLRLCQRKFDEVSTTLQITTTIIVAYASLYFSKSPAAVRAS